MLLELDLTKIIQIVDYLLKLIREYEKELLFGIVLYILFRCRKFFLLKCLYFVIRPYPCWRHNKVYNWMRRIIKSICGFFVRFVVTSEVRTILEEAGHKAYFFAKNLDLSSSTGLRLLGYFVYLMDIVDTLTGSKYKTGFKSWFTFNLFSNFNSKNFDELVGRLLLYCYLGKGDTCFKKVLESKELKMCEEPFCREVRALCGELVDVVDVETAPCMIWLSITRGREFNNENDKIMDLIDTCNLIRNAVNKIKDNIESLKKKNTTH